MLRCLSWHINAAWSLVITSLDSWKRIMESCLWSSFFSTLREEFFTQCLDFHIVHAWLPCCFQFWGHQHSLDYEKNVFLHSFGCPFLCVCAFRQVHGLGLDSNFVMDLDPMRKLTPTSPTPPKANGAGPSMVSVINPVVQSSVSSQGDRDQDKVAYIMELLVRHAV